MKTITDRNVTKRGNYEIVRLNYGIDFEVVEINELNTNYHDFVLMCFQYDYDSCEQAKKLREKYKETDKTICIISCCYLNFFYPDYYLENLGFVYFHRFAEDFDLSCTVENKKEFDSLVLSCCATRLGDIHGDPSDWIKIQKENSKKDNEVFVYMICDNTFSYLLHEMPGLIKDDEETNQISKVIITFLTNKIEFNLTIAELQKFFNQFDSNVVFQCNTLGDCKELEKDEIRMLAVVYKKRIVLSVI